MILIDALLFLIMMFFLFLPITDRKTVQMKLCVLCALVAIFAMSVARTQLPMTQLASVVSSH